MVGINIGVPVPRDPYSFGGWNESKYGHGDITGKSGVEFWTNLKKVTSRWPESEDAWKKYFLARINSLEKTPIFKGKN